MAVLAWDLTGHGARQTEGAASFYRRYKHASRLGAMVGEVQSAMDFIHCSPPEAFNTLPECSDGEFFTGKKSDKNSQLTPSIKLSTERAGWSRRSLQAIGSPGAG